MSANAAVVANRPVTPFEMNGIHAGNLSNHYSEIFPGGHGVVIPGNRNNHFGLHEVTASVKSEPRVGGLAPWQVKKVKQHIDERISHSIPLDELAGQVRLSTSYFSTAFKATFGISPHSYVVMCRVEHAKYRMLHTGAPLCEIALDCGLADQSHLSRVFRRVTGTTPSAWRRHASQPGAAAVIQ